MSKSVQLNQDADKTARGCGLTKAQTADCLLLHSAWNDLTKVWTLPVIHALGLNQPARFNELKRRISGISATSLAERLNELERRKILNRKVYAETPPRVEYALTRKGVELHEWLGHLAAWVKKWDKQGPTTSEPVREEVQPLPRAK